MAEGLAIINRIGKGRVIIGIAGHVIDRGKTQTRRVKKLELVKPQGFREADEQLVKDHCRAQLSPDELETKAFVRKKR